MKKIITTLGCICISFLGSAQTGVNNLSFENWTMSGGPTPSGFISRGATQITTGAEDLNSYARLTSNGQPTTSSMASGAMQLGSIVGMTPVGGSSYTLKPIALSGYYKCNLVGLDTVYIAIALTKNGLSVLSSTGNQIKITVTTSTWTSFSIPLTYLPNLDPDSLHIYLTANKSFAGGSVGSSGTVLDVDNFVLLQNTTGIKQVEENSGLLSAYPNPARENFNIQSDMENASKVEVYDLKGCFMENRLFESQKASISMKNYAPGFYIYKVVDNENRILKIGKFILSE